jgi:hypothetical protein
MGWQRARVGGLVCAIVILQATVVPLNVIVYADGSCLHRVETGVSYFGGDYITGVTTIVGPYSCPSLSSCISDAEAQAVTNCTQACSNSGVGSGQYGVAHCTAQWWVHWNGSFEHYGAFNRDCGSF